MALYSAYFDESTNDKSPVLVVAGFMSADAHWGLFEAEWKAALAEFKIPAFHMVDFAHNAGLFKGWEESTRRALMAKLLEIIQRRAKLGFASVVHQKEFDQIFSDKEHLERVGSAYTLACTTSHLEVGEWAKKNCQIEPIAYFFDAGHEKSGEAAATFLEIKSDPENVGYRMGSITFEHDDALVPLQAADTAAYEIWKWLDAHYLDGARYGRFPLAEIIKIPWTIREFDKAILTELLERIKGAPANPNRIHTMIPALRPGKTAPPGSLGRLIIIP